MVERDLYTAILGVYTTLCHGLVHCGEHSEQELHLQPGIATSPEGLAAGRAETKTGLMQQHGGRAFGAACLLAPGCSFLKKEKRGNLHRSETSVPGQDV